MEITNIQIRIVDTISAQEAFIQEINTCAFCGEALKFDYNVDKFSHAIDECSSCPACKIEMKPASHTLH